MKTIAFIFLAAAISVSAQTNLFISFTNSTGDFITNAEVVKIYPNKIIYHTGAGGGTIRIDQLPLDVQEKVGYDVAKAADADDADSQHKARQDEFVQQQREQANLVALRNAASEKVNRTKHFLFGRVIQKLDDGLLVSEGGLEDFDRQTILVKDYPGEASVAAEDNIHSVVYPEGLFSYTTVNNSKNTVHAYTCSLPTAVDFYLQQ